MHISGPNNYVKVPGISVLTLENNIVWYWDANARPWDKKGGTFWVKVVLRFKRQKKWKKVSCELKLSCKTRVFKSLPWGGRLCSFSVLYEEVTITSEQSCGNWLEWLSEQKKTSWGSDSGDGMSAGVGSGVRVPKTIANENRSGIRSAAKLG